MCARGEGKSKVSRGCWNSWDLMAFFYFDRLLAVGNSLSPKFAGGGVKVWDRSGSDKEGDVLPTSIG